jgi:hypothetical protein
MLRFAQSTPDLQLHSSKDASPRCYMLVLQASTCIIKTTSLALPIVKPNRCSSFSNYLFLYNTIHVSDGLSVHHQEFRTVYTATGVCQTDTTTCLLAGMRWNCVPSHLMDGRLSETCRVLYKINNLRNWCIWLVLL